MLKPFNLHVYSSDAIYWYFCDLYSDLNKDLQDLPVDFIELDPNCEFFRIRNGYQSSNLLMCLKN